MEIDTFQCFIIHNQLLFKFPHASFNRDMTEKPLVKPHLGYQRKAVFKENPRLSKKRVFHNPVKWISPC